MKLSLNEAGHVLRYLTEYCAIVDWYNSNNKVGNITLCEISSAGYRNNCTQGSTVHSSPHVC